MLQTCFSRNTIMDSASNIITLHRTLSHYSLDRTLFFASNIITCHFIQTNRTIIINIPTKYHVIRCWYFFISFSSDINCFVVWLINERSLALFPVGTIVKDPHHRESLSRREKDLNLRRTWVQAFLNEVVQ